MIKSLITKKEGMTSIFGPNGNMIPATMVSVVPATVVAKKTKKSHGYNAILVAAGDAKEKNVPKSQRGFYKSIGTKCFAKLKEFRVLGDNDAKIGDIIDGSSLSANDVVDAQGISIGKGFAGPMKRHNFAGLEATHGVSVSHRSHGSTGQCQDPGRVFKNKKMAGQMGFKKTSLQNLKILSISRHGDKMVIAIKGSIPGSKGSTIYLKPASKKNFYDQSNSE